MPLEREASELAHWIPPTVTMALLLLVLVILARGLAKRLDKQDGALDLIKDRLPTLATKQELTNMGDRFDAKHTKLADEVSALRGRLEERSKR
jgi:hypothetical protein